MSFIPFSFGVDCYSLTDSYLNIRYAILLFLFSLMTGSFGFMLIEGYTLLEGFYMAVITISTVGYTEVHSISKAGQLFASIYIIMNIGIFAYAVSAFSKYIIYGEFFKNMHISMIEKKIAQLKDHVIICGYGRYSTQIANNFMKHNIPFSVIERNPQKIEQIQKSSEKLLYIDGDATHDEALISAGIKNCKALISVMDDDASNLFTVLTARTLNNDINIISRTKEISSEKKLKLAGADHVIMPEQIGGFYIANLVNKPDAVEFFNYITEESDMDISFEELEYNSMPEGCRGLSIRDLHIRKKTGANIIGYKNQAGEYVVNPDPDTAFEKYTSFIIIGTRTKLKNLLDYLGNYSESV